MKQSDVRTFKSRWDRSTWILLMLVTVCFIASFFLNDDGCFPIIIAGLIWIFVIVLMISIRYEVKVDQLVVYRLFIPFTVPVSKIAEIRPIKSYLSAPATSLTHRIALKMKDRSVLKSSMPLVLSPDNQAEFIETLIRINPDIIVYFD